MHLEIFLFASAEVGFTFAFPHSWFQHQQIELSKRKQYGRARNN